jgi:hypothetical protein
MDKVQLKKTNQAILEEISRYKWIESEKEGRDIGSNRAAFEWLERYYDLWRAQHSDLIAPFC